MDFGQLESQTTNDCHLDLLVIDLKMKLEIDLLKVSLSTPIETTRVRLGKSMASEKMLVKFVLFVELHSTNLTFVLPTLMDELDMPLQVIL